MTARHRGRPSEATARDWHLELAARASHPGGTTWRGTCPWCAAYVARHAA